MCTPFRPYHSILRSTTLVGMFILVWMAVASLPNRHALAGMDATDLKALPSYAIIQNESIKEFEGCQHGKIIQFVSGNWVQCREYGSWFAGSSRNVDAIILAMAHDYKGKKLLQCRMMTTQDIYDIDCEDYMDNTIIAMLMILKDTVEHPNEGLRTYIQKKFKVLEGVGLGTWPLNQDAAPPHKQ